MRSMRQIPIEMDPPEHTDFRTLLEPVFKRPTQNEYRLDMEAMIGGMVADLLGVGELEIRVLPCLYNAGLWRSFWSFGI